MQSPNVADDFTANTGPSGLAVGHQAARGRKDGDTESVANSRHVITANVLTSTRFTDAYDSAKHGIIRLVVARKNLDASLRAFVDVDITFDEALLFEKVYDAELDT
jgi:hypothetical protein